MFMVEIIYATLKKQSILKIEVEEGSTVNDVINKSGLLDEYPEIDLSVNKVGVYNQVKKLDEVVKNADRIEIYRPLLADPKEVRRKRAIKQKEQGIIRSP